MLKRKIRAYCSHVIRGYMGSKCLEEQRNFNKAKAVEWGKRLWEYFGSNLEMYIPGANDEWAVIGMQKGYLTIDQVLDIDCGIVAQADVLIVMDWEGISGGMKMEIAKAKELGIPIYCSQDLSERTLEELKKVLERL